MNKEDCTQIISLDFQFGNLELNQLDDTADGVLSIRTKFLDYPSIEFNENDLCNSCPTGEARFEKAKHMLFPINDKDLIRLKNNFTINIKIMKTSIVEELLPVMKQVGYTNLNITRTFTTLLSNVKTKPTKECPAVKVLSDQLEVVDACTASVIGTVNVYIRIKSFGNCIVTGMQELMENKTNVFKQCFNDKDVIDDDDNDDDDDEEPNDDDTAAPGIKDKKSSKPPKQLGIIDNLRGGVFNIDNVADNIRDPRESKDELGGTDLKGQKGIQNTAPSQRKKAATGQPADDQTVKIIPILDYVPEEYQGPLSGLPVNDTVNVYALYVGKKNAKKKVFSRINMEVRVPKPVTRSKERYTRDVQCEQK